MVWIPWSRAELYCSRTALKLSCSEWNLLCYVSTMMPENRPASTVAAACGETPLLSPAGDPQSMHEALPAALRQA